MIGITVLPPLQTAGVVQGDSIVGIGARVGRSEVVAIGGPIMGHRGVVVVVVATAVHAMLGVMMRSRRDGGQRCGTTWRNEGMRNGVNEVGRQESEWVSVWVQSFPWMFFYVEGGLKVVGEETAALFITRVMICVAKA